LRSSTCIVEQSDVLALDLQMHRCGGTFRLSSGSTDVALAIGALTQNARCRRSEAGIDRCFERTARLRFNFLIVP
jgi:hypothetical protein